jgi:HAE1 family hydrophobic/amphiphilic exporter-1
MHEIAGAIVAITLMKAVFIPVAFMSGPVGFFIDNFNYDGNCNHSFGNRGIDIDTCTLCYNVKKTIIKAKKKTPINRFVDGFNNTFNLAQGKYQNLLGKIINRRAITLLHLCVLCRTWLISSTVLDLSQMRIKDVIIQTPPIFIRKNE